MNILVVDDEPNILTLMDAILSAEGYRVIPANNGSDALDIFLDKHIDMVICDEMMPLLSGNELVSAIREEDTDIPIIMVTAKGGIDDKGKSFSLGIDDYMVKPISADELLMRVKALFRRAKIVTDKKITVGNVVLDYNTRTITDDSRNLSLYLTKTEFEILYKLLSYPEKPFTKWQLFREFWGINSDTDDSIVKVFISKIRKQIEVFPEIGIKTIMGVGYQGVKNEK